MTALILMSGDPEELALASAFMEGQRFATHSHVLVPRKLYPAGAATGLPAAEPYSSAEEVLEAVERLKPDIAILFSAYSFSLDGLLSPAGLKSILDRLRQRGCALMTSDPLLGLAPRITLRDLRWKMVGLRQPPFRRAITQAAALLLPSRTPLFRLPELHDVVHVYPGAVPAADGKIDRISFFNPQFAQAPVTQPDGEQPRWLFVMSQSDLHAQLTLVGLRELVERVLGILRFALEVERRPTLLAPPLLIRRLAPTLGQSTELLSACALPALRRRLLDAEHAFYWDPYSILPMIRMAAGLPVFLFDRGYLAHTFRPFYEVAKNWRFGAWEPVFLDQRHVFNPYVLAHLARQHEPALRALGRQWETCATPDQIVAQVAARAARGAR